MWIYTKKREQGQVMSNLNLDSWFKSAWIMFEVCGRVWLKNWYPYQ